MGMSKVSFIVLLVLLFHSTTAEDKQALLDFATSMAHSRPLNWEESSSMCTNWTGITCAKDGSHVIALRLPGFGFSGAIPPNTISRLAQLQVLSLRSNRISGNFPDDLYLLKNLSFLYLQHNNLSGPLPYGLSLFGNLISLDLSHNQFTGTMPISLSSLTNLTSLNLAENLLSGDIPGLDLPKLQFINLSSNHLSGRIPTSLRKFPDTMFVGNNLLSSDEHGKPKRRETVLLAVAITAAIFFFFLSGFLFLLCCNKKKEGSTKAEKGKAGAGKWEASKKEERHGMVFFPGSEWGFDLEDLLTASAEVLGKGTFGMTYKAILEDGTTVVVKRLKDVSAGKREFSQQMDTFGGIKHDNVAGVKAYYHSKDEKLIVYDYRRDGSVSTLLHGGTDRMDWPARVKIAIGCARGLAHIHSLKLVHGNVKASNIFVNSDGYGCVGEQGLSSWLMVSRASGYRGPEITDTRRATQAADVYGFGVVLLELLTGKAPIHTTNGEQMIHLVRWVQSVVREEWTAEVFDVELIKHPKIEEELVEMLQIALTCVARIPDQRPKMLHVLPLIQNVHLFNS